MVTQYITRGPDLAAQMKQKTMLAKFYNPILGSKYLKLLEQINSMASCGLNELIIKTSNYNEIRRDETEMITQYLKEDGFEVDTNPNLLWVNPMYENTDLHQITIRIRW